MSHSSDDEEDSLNEYIPTSILVTGGCGFIGSHVVRMLVSRYPHTRVVNLDSLEYCSSHVSVADLEAKAVYRFVHGSIMDPTLLSNLLEQESVDTVLHFAAQTHVDNSFGNSIAFTHTNVLGTHTLLECVRVYGRVRRFVLVSTDEIRGDVAAHESVDRMAPTNPYAASKAAAELLARSYSASFGLPLIITRSNNVYGPGQYPEKIVPRFAARLLQGMGVPLHGSGTNRRTYLHVMDVVHAFEIILARGVLGEVYNIASDDELTNEEVAHRLLAALGLEAQANKLIVHVRDRVFNDPRYHIDPTSTRALGWRPAVTLDNGFNETIEWYRNVNYQSYWAHPVHFSPHDDGHSPL